MQETPKMKFELMGRIVFEADDTFDAFRLLAAHFTALADQRESALPLIGTNVKIKPLGVSTPVPPATSKKTTLRGHRKA
jgi:hypothetical protein